ncbi:unnamed protein product [Rotaria magnacalcarata]|uniref:Uncharacterized protein n=1 Tax=Rotaria magnacalcarata TaxID=392030 RepID=A0A816H8J4_9BILA|nr:unnamed protein product [Rotaria magnacalcarata]CAF1682677.1 unnamed protein product [Rotaria magnacalcarata]CAF2006414.1 unnamed protein product [Rotaria magnacalcarata]CAF3967823.1 unnamed protein product [Rotaria magnacalcarata]CAF3971085.1 unnamed protein product [Rotaria magnacalcarata]
MENYNKFILNPDSITKYDIPFAKAYRNLLQQYPTENLLTLLLHVDGIPLSKSSKLKLWICDASIVEIPPHLRVRRSNMFLISVYIGYTEPNVNIWVKTPFTAINELKNKVFQVPNIHASFKVKVYGCIGDSPALKLMCNMIGHNGYLPCYYCDIKGIHVKKARKRQYPYTPSTKYRSIN